MPLNILELLRASRIAAKPRLHALLPSTTGKVAGGEIGATGAKGR